MGWLEVIALFVAVGVGLELRLFMYTKTYFVPAAMAINKNAVAALALYHAFVKALKKHDINVEEEFTAVLAELSELEEAAKNDGQA